MQDALFSRNPAYTVLRLSSVEQIKPISEAFNCLSPAGTFGLFPFSCARDYYKTLCSHASHSLFT